MVVAAAWLPPPGDGEAEAAVTRALDGWLAEWISQPSALRVTAVVGVKMGAIEIEPRELAAIGLAACDHRADPENPGDRAVLEAIGQAIVADLSQRFRSDHSRQFEVAADEWRVCFNIGEADLIEARRAAAGTAKAAALAPLADALAAEPASLGCHLGGATLTTAEIAALTVGDVVVLDRALETPVPLTVEGTLARAGKAAITADARMLRISLLEPLDLARKN